MFSGKKMDAVTAFMKQKQQENDPNEGKPEWGGGQALIM
jgi:hypothetical protein